MAHFSFPYYFTFPSSELRIHTTNFGILNSVGCFGFETVFQSISDRLPEGEKEKDMIDERKKCPKNPHPHLLRAQKVLALLLSK